MGARAIIAARPKPCTTAFPPNKPNENCGFGRITKLPKDKSYKKACNKNLQPSSQKNDSLKLQEFAQRELQTYFKKQQYDSDFGQELDVFRVLNKL